MKYSEAIYKLYPNNDSNLNFVSNLSEIQNTIEDSIDKFLSHDFKYNNILLELEEKLKYCLTAYNYLIKINEFKLKIIFYNNEELFYRFDLYKLLFLCCFSEKQVNDIIIDNPKTKRFDMKVGTITEFL